MSVHRSVLATLAAAVAYFGAPSLALADTPAFVVAPAVSVTGRVADTELDFSFPLAAAAVAKITVYVPAGYSLDLSGAAGATIGAVDANLLVGGRQTEGIGPVKADAPASYATNTCAPGLHQAVWVLAVAWSGQTYPIAVFVDATSGTETARGAYRLVTCFLSPDVAGGAPANAKVVDLAVDLPALVTAPTTAGLQRWRALVTPFTPGTSTLNGAATYEIDAVVPLPQRLTLTARLDKRNRVVLTGTATVLGAPLSGVPVTVFAGQKVSGTDAKPIGIALTNKRGVFTLPTTRTKGFYAAAFIGEDTADCETPALADAPAGCIHESLSPIFSNVLKVVVKKPRGG